MGGRKFATRNACGGNPDCHRSKVLLLSDTRGWSHHCRLFLPTCWTPALPGAKKSPSKGWPHSCSQALGKAPIRAGSLMLVACGFPTYVSSPGPCDTGSCATFGPCPYRGQIGYKCSRVALGGGSCGWPTYRGGAKITTETQGGVTKRNKNISVQLHKPLIKSLQLAW